MIAADRTEIERFIRAVFRHADEGVFASVRCFPQETTGAPEIRALRIDGAGLGPLASMAFAMADRAARGEKETVVCLLTAVFTNAKRAREQDVANCLALSVDLDSNPGRGLESLRGLLGPPTLVVTSGGLWTSSETGTVEPKLHVYWRLSEPTRTPEEHASLKRGRRIATALVGGDTSNVPLVHPLRLPGSVHRKGEPRLARIIEENPDCEIHLEDAFEDLETAAAAHAIAIARNGDGAHGVGDPREIKAIIADILSGTAYHTSLVALSARYAGGGMTRPKIVETLQGLMLAVPLEKRDGGQPGRWQSRYDDIERIAASAVEKFAPDPAAAQHGAQITEALLRSAKTRANRPDTGAGQQEEQAEPGYGGGAVDGEQSDDDPEQWKDQTGGRDGEGQKGDAGGHGQAGGAGGQQAGGATAGTAGPAGQGTAGQGRPGAGPGTAGKTSALKFNLNDWDARAVFAGDAPPLEWLVRHSIPRGVAGIIASAGDVGKSYLCLELGLRVTCGKPGGSCIEAPLLGGSIVSYGAAVFITAEDGRGSVHRRIRALDPDGKRQAGRQFPLFVVPLPDAGGLFPIVSDERHKIRKTPQLDALRQQLRAIPDIALVVLDPLVCFAHADINADPLAAALVMASLNEIAVETGATVLVAHHVRKEQGVPIDAQDARHLIRGSSALVDQSRFAIVLWPSDPEYTHKTCKLLGVDYAPNAIVHCAVVKSNDGADRTIRTLLRDNTGMLRDVTSDLKVRGGTREEHLAALKTVIAKVAKDGRPFTRTGENGVYRRRDELGPPLATMARARLEGLTDELLREKQVVRALAGGTTTKWLDVPDGPFARGEGGFARGATNAKPRRKRSKRPRSVPASRSPKGTATRRERKSATISES